MSVDILGLIIMSISTAIALSPALLLSPLIAHNRTEVARKLSSVNPKLFLNVSSHAGFLTVDEQYNTNTFFWYFPVPEKPLNETPLILWLQGGPGATSLVGLFDEIGPFEYKDKELKLRELSWAHTHSMIFIDNPAGTGYSFTDDSRGFVTDMETCANHLYNALTQFLKIFPELSKSPLYIAGESYAGRYLPALGMKIFEENKDLGYDGVHLQGIIMGNPVIGRDKNKDFSSMFYQWGLIDPQGKLAVKPIQDAYTQAVVNNEPQKAAKLRDKLLNRLRTIAMVPHIIQYNVLNDDIHLEGFEELLQREEIKEAIHVGDRKFAFTNGTTYSKLVNDFFSDSTQQVTTLLDHYRILIYCGQLDMMAPCVPNSEERRDKWRWRFRDYFMKAPRTPWWYNDSITGYVKDGGGFTEVFVEKAGHMVPIDKPGATLELITHFLEGTSFPMPSNYYPSPNDTPNYYIIENNIRPQYNYHTAMVISVVINVFLVAAIVAGVWYVVKWKRRSGAMFYSTVDDTSMSDAVLTMT